MRERSVLTTKGASGTTTESTTAEEPLEHLLGAQLILPHPASHVPPPCACLSLREPGEGVLRLCLVEPAVRVTAELVVLLPFLLVAEHAERPRYHLESLVGVLVAVLVRVGQQGLLAVGLLDVRLGAGLAHGFYAEDVVEVCAFTPADAHYCRLLLLCVLAVLVALGVFSVAG